MKLRLAAFCLAAVLSSHCTSLYSDTGQPDPASWWPWVCDDGGLAPESGCPPPPSCPEDDDGDGGADGGC